MYGATKVPVIIDIRCRAKTIHTQTGTKDLQMVCVHIYPLLTIMISNVLECCQVNISLRLLSQPKIEMLPTIYKTLGIDFDERILPSVGNEVLKSVVARVNQLFKIL